MDTLTTSVQELKELAAANEGRNVADADFRNRVESLLDLFYSDIGEIRRIELSSLFDLFLLKALYVERRSTSIEAISYLGDLMARHLRVRDIFPIPDLAAHFAQVLERMLSEAGGVQRDPQNLFEANRGIGDSTMFLLGIFPATLTRRRDRRTRWNSGTPRFDSSFYQKLGRSHYSRAAEHELAQWTGQDHLLNKLSNHFDVYVAALNEVAVTYIHGFEVERVTNLMLDSYNAWRRTRDEHHMENVRKYAALLAIDPRRAFRRAGGGRRRSLPVLSPTPSGS